MIGGHVPAFCDYLALGFTPDVDRANAYLRRLCETAVAPSTDDFPRLLAAIVDARLAGQGEVAIPLTGGKDSRALLGATLHVLPTSSIRCYTFGTPASTDVRVAASLCKALSIRHTAVDASAFVWDFDELVARARKRYLQSGALPPIDGLLMFERLAAAIPSEFPVLSGFLGGALTGARLPNDALARREIPAAVDAFVARHRTLLGGGKDARLRNLFGGFLRKLRPQEHLPHMTGYDSLDLAFRQDQRIRSVAMDSFRNCIAPFEHPRSVGYWLRQPVDRRVGQAAYIACLERSFPGIFRRHFRISSLLPGRFHRWLPREAFAPFVNRGDPRQNESERRFLAECARSFDARKIDGAASAEAALARLLDRPTASDRITVFFAASVEVHVAAGNLASLPDH